MSNTPLNHREWEEIRKKPEMRRSLAWESLEWHFHLYFPHYVEYETAEFQKEMMRLAGDPYVKQLAIVAFRDSGKSSLLNTALALWAVTGRLQKKYVVIVSQTQWQARQHLDNIAKELETNGLLRKDFWPYDYEDNETGASTITLPKFGARIIAVSREQGVRGLRYGRHRPDLIIADDVEDSNTVRTKEGRDRNFAWFTGELLPIGGDNAKIIIMGNLLHEDSLLKRLQNGINSGKRDGVYKEFPIERGEEPLWPQRFPDRQAVNRLERSIGDPVRFEREYRLNIVPDEEQVITRGMIQYYKEIPPLKTGERRRIIVGVDLAISENDSGDYNAMVTIEIRGSGANMQMYVYPNPVNKRMGFNDTVDTIVDLNAALRSPGFYVETTAYQRAMEHTLRDNTIDVTGVMPNQDKRTRLNMIARDIERGAVLFPETGCEDLIAQLTGFGVEKHDDLADALTTAVIEELRQESTGGTALLGRHNLFNRTGR